MEKKERNGVLAVLVMVIMFIMAGLFMSAVPQGKGQAVVPQGQGQPIISKLGVYRGDIFRNFAEFRVQKSTFDAKGIITLENEPYEMLININQIVKVHRFEDGKKTDYSSLMYISEDKHPRGVVPVLVREEYKDVLRKMKRAIESR